MTRMEENVVRVVSQVGVGGVLLYAGCSKVFVSGVAEFLKDVGNFQIAFLQAPWDEVIAYGMPWFEIVVGVCLLADFWRQGAGICAFVLSLIFLGAVGSAWMRGIDLHCGCFGKSLEAVHYPSKMAALLVQMVASALVVWFGKGRRGFFHLGVAEKSISL